jgi:succinoglycan biosynthesis transport protein ExoP
MYNPVDADAMAPAERRQSLRRMNPRPGEQAAFVGRPLPLEGWPLVPRTPAPPRLDLIHSLRWLRARFWLLVLTALLGALGGFLFVHLVKPTYTVNSEVLVDPSSLKVISDDLFTESQQRDTQLLDAESKLRILTSGNVLARVVNELKLDQDPEFVGDPAGFSLTTLLGLSGPPEKVDPALAALRTLDKRVRAGREERSFVVTLTVWTEAAAKSVLIANKLVAAFQEELVKAEADNAGRTAAALFDRLDGLKASVAAADQAVEAFKREHGLQSSSGELVSTLLANQVNSRVIDAQNRVIQAESRYKGLTSPDANGARSANALQSDTMTELRARYAVIKAQADAQAAVLAPGHPTLIGLRAQLQTIETQIADETARIVQGAKTELDAAQVSLAALAGEADKMKSSVFADKEAQAELHQLERDAESKAAIYQTFLTRARQVTERQQLNTTNVRVITPALPPASRSWPPRTAMVMGAGMGAGLLFGGVLSIGLGLLGDLRRARRA